MEKGEGNGRVIGLIAAVPTAYVLCEQEDLVRRTTSLCYVVTPVVMGTRRLMRSLNKAVSYLMTEYDSNQIGYLPYGVRPCFRWLEWLSLGLDHDPHVGKISSRIVKECERACPEDILLSGTGRGWLIRTEALIDTGEFDEGFLGSVDYGMWDYENRMIQHGWSAMVSTNSQLVDDDLVIECGEVDCQLLRAAEERYLRKWGQRIGMAQHRAVPLGEHERRGGS